MGFRWIVSQIGARQHYGVPRGFHHLDSLRLLYTDAWCRTGQSWLRYGPPLVRAFAGRHHPDIPPSKVMHFNFRSLLSRMRYGDPNANIVEQHLHYLRVGKWFSTQVAKDLSQRKLDPSRDLFFGFNTGCLETIQLLRDRGVFAVIDQIDPARVEEQLVYEESERWPGWQRMPGRVPDAYWDRMDAEWKAASLIVVNSNWSRTALIKQGVPETKIVVIPPPYEPQTLRIPFRENFDRPITVLWLGLVTLRKGIQYLIEAARLLEKNSRINFVIVGPIHISEQALKSAPANMRFVGRITREETGSYYRQADVFVLPTLSDGFAVSQLEAMAHGLPVIATPNCGEVVANGVDGLMVPAFNGPAIAAAIEQIDGDRQLLREMSYRALDKSTHFHLPRQAQQLEAAVLGLRENGSLTNTASASAQTQNAGIFSAANITPAFGS